MKKRARAVPDAHIRFIKGRSTMMMPMEMAVPVVVPMAMKARTACQEM